MWTRSFVAAFVLGLLGGGMAKADVIYKFFDATHPTVLDLEFAVAEQLAPTASARQQNFISVGGAFSSDYAGGHVQYLDISQPVLAFSGPSGFFGNFTFTGLNQDTVPGNGVFSGLGQLGIPRETPIASLGSVTISGVTPVPEFPTWALLSLGFLGLAASRLRLKRDSSAVVG